MIIFLKIIIIRNLTNLKFGIDVGNKLIWKDKFEMAKETSKFLGN